MRSLRSIRMAPALGLLALSFLSGCSHKDEQAGGAKDKVVVRVASPIERLVTDYEYFTGRTYAVDRVDVRARVTGYLDKINFEDGKAVAKDQVLFVIDPRPYAAELEKAKGQLALAQANTKLALVSLKRGQNVAKTPGAISQQDLDKLAAEASSADAAVQSALASRDLADLNLKFTRVTSPVNGVVGRTLLTIGNLVTQDSTLLTTVVSMNPMYVYFDVDERTLLRVQALIRAGKINSVKDGSRPSVQVGLANEGDTYPHQGFIDFVNNEVDATTGTIQVRAVLPNLPTNANVKGVSRFLFTPGLFVRVRLPIGDAHKALLVPQAALGTDQGRKFVYIVNDQNVVEYRSVVPAAEQPDGLQVVEPVSLIGISANGNEAGQQKQTLLRATDKIIVGGLQRVRAGMKVETRPAVAAK